MNKDEMIKACKPDELRHDKPYVVSILAKKVGVFRRRDGHVYAIELTCKHQGADLSKGDISAGVVTCPRHGWRYNLETGECVNKKNSLPLRHHKVLVEEGMVYVSQMTVK